MYCIEIQGVKIKKTEKYYCYRWQKWKAIKIRSKKQILKRQ